MSATKLEIKNNVLDRDERIFYRDRLRYARYAALADAEGFSEICFAIEALGMRLCQCEADMGTYFTELDKLAKCTLAHEELAKDFPGRFTRFIALYNTVRKARNDAMHSGSYARHATLAAVELCICLEEAIMSGKTKPTKVADFMVKIPVSIEPWQPIAYARQLMLMYSFSFLPVYLNDWKLLSEYSLAKFLNSQDNRRRRVIMALTVEDAEKNGLELQDAEIINPEDEVSSVLQSKPGCTPALWLVVEHNKQNSLVGVLTPFELM